MESNINSELLSNSVKQLSAIAHEGRLVLLRLLIQAGPEGISATTVANLAQTKLPTASARLLVLTNAGLATSSRAGRHIIYRADFNSMSRLLRYLTLDCCGANQTICEPLMPALKHALENCCNPTPDQSEMEN